MRASEEQIARYLEGNWQEDLLFLLKQEQEAYEFRQQQMAACDRQMEQYLQQKEERNPAARLPEERRRCRLKQELHKPQFNLHAELFRTYPARDLQIGQLKLREPNSDFASIKLTQPKTRTFSLTAEDRSFWGGQDPPPST